jgi:endonuclease/exonuclease/phosphatase family metal-dependent hydrolase
MPLVRVALWNLEWMPPGSRRAEAVRALLDEAEVDLACLIEALDGTLEGGHEVVSQADYGYCLHPGRRKVRLWSRQPWDEVDTLGHPELPSGRFVAATTPTPVGPLRVTGLCIPWSAAHVSSGRKDRRRWEDHLAYLAALGPILRTGPSQRHVVLGDFNQTVPKTTQPVAVSEALAAALPPTLALATGGTTDGRGRHAIDHVAHTPDLTARIHTILPAGTDAIAHISDHFGVVVDLEA